MASNTVPSVKSTGPGQVRLPWPQRVAGAVDRFLDRRVEAARQATDQPNQAPEIRPSLIVLSE